MRHAPHLNADQRQFLIKHVIDQEVKSALKCINDNTAPGIDSFGGKFFKETWNTINKDVINVIREFFEKDSMLKAINSIVVTLIPKTNQASKAKDYKPIS